MSLMDVDVSGVQFSGQGIQDMFKKWDYLVEKQKFQREKEKLVRKGICSMMFFEYFCLLKNVKFFRYVWFGKKKCYILWYNFFFFFRGKIEEVYGESIYFCMY